MKIIAITGNIGSGKTTVTNIFQQDFGFKVINADICNKIVSVKYKYKYNYNILRKLIFTNQNYRIFINKVIHPLIRIEILNQLKLTKNMNIKYCIIEIPLLNKYKLFKYYYYINKVISVNSTIYNKFNRVIKRDNQTYQSIKNLLSLQIDDEERKKFSDFIIYNNYSLQDLFFQIKDIVKYLK